MERFLTACKQLISEAREHLSTTSADVIKHYDRRLSQCLKGIAFTISNRLTAGPISERATVQVRTSTFLSYGVTPSCTVYHRPIKVQSQTGQRPIIAHTLPMGDGGSLGLGLKQCHCPTPTRRRCPENALPPAWLWTSDN